MTDTMITEKITPSTESPEALVARLARAGRAAQLRLARMSDADKAKALLSAAAALREAEEEIGLARQFVKPIGYGDGFLTITNFVVRPVVALVEEGFALKAHEGEVAEIFEVPLAFLMDLANCQVDSRISKGLARYFYVYPYGGRRIWGATAGMIRNLHERLYR